MSQAELSLISSGAGDDARHSAGHRAATGTARDGDLVAVVLGSLVGTFSVIAFPWLAVLGFAGGAVPILGWSLPGGLVHGLRFLAVLATAGTLVLGVVPLAASMVVYAVLSRLVPALVKAPRPRRAAIRQDRPLDQAA